MQPRRVRIALSFLALLITAGAASTAPAWADVPPDPGAAQTAGPPVEAEGDATGAARSHDGATAEENPLAEALVPVTGAIDDRAYRYFELDNGLEVLVVSDPETDQAAAALSVGVGSFAEPESRPGLAHFLEHMLFLGTEKYPSPDEYADYIARHGGSRNAYTALDHTNYFFSIAAEHLEGGLDRFAQFFVAPLFTAEYVTREKSAVHSEYQMQLRDDGWRTYMTQKRALNPEHPGSRFTIGSLDTLADREERTVREELIEFYERHYSADRMALVILGREDPSTLATWAREMFGGVPRREVTATESDVPMFREADLPSLLAMEPVKERRILEITFGLPPADDLYRVAPGTYLANLLGHEGRGSLHAWLREQGWIDGLSAASSRFGEHNSSLTVRMVLTESGFEHWREAGAALFAYLEAMRGGGVSERRFEEQRDLTRLAFQFQEKGEPFGYVRRLSRNMLVYPPEDVVRGPSAMDDYDAEVIGEFLDALRPERAQVSLIAPEVQTEEIEPWFDVPYRLQPLDEAVVARWQDPEANEALHLPPPNPFVPEALGLIDAGAEQPTRIVDRPAFTLWHLPDPSFRVPKAQLRLDVRTPAAGATVEDQVLATLYTRLVMDELNEYAYPALLAGLSFGLASSGDAITLSMGGFDDKLDVLLEQVLDTMRELEVKPDRFRHHRTELVRDLNNSREDRPYQQTMGELTRLLEIPEYEIDALIEAAEAADPEQLAAWTKRALDAPRAVALVHGNVDAERARDLGDAVATSLGLGERAEAVPPKALVRLPEAVISRRVEAPHDDAALTLYVQGRDQSWPERARFGLLAHMLGSPYFNALRTDRQLGYVVSAGAWVRHNTPGIYFVVQSPVAAPATIETATFAFLEAYDARLAAMTEEEFEAERQGLLSRVLERDENLSARTRRLWRDLQNGLVEFDSRERIAEAVRALTLDEMRAFYGTFRELARTRRAATWAAGQFALPEAAPAGRRVDDLGAFKNDAPVFTAEGGVAADDEKAQTPSAEPGR